MGGGRCLSGQLGNIILFYANSGWGQGCYIFCKEWDSLTDPKCQEHPVKKLTGGKNAEKLELSRIAGGKIK